ncbi:MAG: hypothetical protein U1D00_20970 [Mycobacterium sp.]|nr:hypothetical protein [Mycobacterium sp.]
MVTIPAVAWRGGPLRRALTIGGSVGLCLGVLAWLDSGLPFVGAVVFAVGGGIYGFWMSRRMARFWPESARLTGVQRVTVVRAARCGRRIEDESLAQSVGDYARGLHAAAEVARPWRWLPPVLLVVAVLTAIWDAVFGSWGSAVASAVYLVALIAELFWWPQRRAALLAGADRAAALSR